MTFLTDNQINEMAEAILNEHEKVHLDKWDKIRVAQEFAFENWNIRPRQINKSAIHLAIKIANMGWNEVILRTKQEIEVI